MTKKMIWAEVCSHSPSWLDGTLAEAIKMIRAEIKVYGPSARIEYDVNFYYDYDPNPSPKISILVFREETDAEYEKRTAIENKWKAEQEVRDRAQYELLKKQFGEK